MPEHQTPEEQATIRDWMNLPPGVEEVSLWAALHDAQIVSIRSDPLERTMTFHLECDHLLEFHKLPPDLQFHLRLDGVQSARVHHYAVWPGAFSISRGASRQEKVRQVDEYQSKWREESLNWSDLEKAITTDCRQVIDIADATLATFPDDSVALRISGLLNYTEHRELFLRAEALSVSRGTGQELGIAALTKMGEEYWEAFEREKQSERSP